MTRQQEQEIIDKVKCPNGCAKRDLYYYYQLKGLYREMGGYELTSLIHVDKGELVSIDCSNSHETIWEKEN